MGADKLSAGKCGRDLAGIRCGPRAAAPAHPAQNVQVVSPLRLSAGAPSPAADAQAGESFTWVDTAACRTWASVGAFMAARGRSAGLCYGWLSQPSPSPRPADRLSGFRWLASASTTSISSINPAIRQCRLSAFDPCKAELACWMCRRHQGADGQAEEAPTTYPMSGRH